MDTQDPRIPVTLLTGFLGAGKTTLLNKLIRDPDAGRIVVIMNEFGKAGLDHDLIEASTEETVLMQSGCLCCTFRGDISKTLGSLIERRNIGELAFDRVVIETTGIADPAPILHTLVVDELIAEHYRLDGVVTVADAAAGPSTLDMHTEAVNQIAIADLIIVTKTDLVSASDLSTYEKRIAGLNTTATIIHAQNGQIPKGSLFGWSPFQQGATESDVEQWLGAVIPKTDTASQHSHDTSGQIEVAGNGVSATAPLARHDRQIRSTSIEIPAPIPHGLFDVWLDTLIAFKGPDVLRIKGIVHVEGAEYPFVFHGVQHIFDAPVPLKSWKNGEKISRIAVIVRDMSDEDLKASLDMLRVRPNSMNALSNTENTPQPLELPF